MGFPIASVVEVLVTLCLLHYKECVAFKWLQHARPLFI